MGTVKGSPTISIRLFVVVAGAGGDESILVTMEMLPIHHHGDVMKHIVRASPLERVRLVPSDSDDRCPRSQGCSSVLLEACGVEPRVWA